MLRPTRRFLPANLLPALALLAAPAPAHDVRGQTLDTWLAQIRPAAEELRFEAIPWRAELGIAVREAQAAERPILLWAMNGHPLGCTWNNGVVARRSVWADPKVVELAGRFVPAADEVGRLQRGDDWECRLFRQLAEQGHYAGRTEPSDTRQGIYAAAPGGVLLGSINTRDPGKLARMLEQALEKWSGLSREQRIGAPAPADESRRRERQYPDDGLVLEVVARDVQRKLAVFDWTAHAWNRDYAWFTGAEARALVPVEISEGAEQPWPAALAQRLVRCHLVDDVRGQVPAFAREAVERAEIVTRVESIAGDVVRLSLRGATRAAQTGHWPVQGFEDGRAPKEQSRGFEAELEGRAVFDRAAGRFTSFELVAIGSRWGGTQFNGRGGDLDPAPMGVALVLDADGPRVAPALIWEY